MTLDEYLGMIRATPDEVERFLGRRGADGLQPNRGWTYDAELGWVHADAVHAGEDVPGLVQQQPARRGQLHLPA